MLLGFKSSLQIDLDKQILFKVFAQNVLYIENRTLQWSSQNDEWKGR